MFLSRGFTGRDEEYSFAGYQTCSIYRGDIQVEAIRALWLFSAFGKFVGLRDGSRWKISVRFAGAFAVCLSKNICEIGEFKFPLLRSELDEISRGSFWPRFMAKIICSLGPTLFKPRLLPRRTDTKTAWSHRTWVYCICVEGKTNKRNSTKTLTRLASGIPRNQWQHFTA